jgi:hypothetical protein
LVKLLLALDNRPSTEWLSDSLAEVMSRYLPQVVIAVEVISSGKLSAGPLPLSCVN